MGGGRRRGWNCRCGVFIVVEVAPAVALLRGRRDWGCRCAMVVVVAVRRTRCCRGSRHSVRAVYL